MQRLGVSVLLKFLVVGSILVVSAAYPYYYPGWPSSNGVQWTSQPYNSQYNQYAQQQQQKQTYQQAAARSTAPYPSIGNPTFNTQYLKPKPALFQKAAVRQMPATPYQPAAVPAPAQYNPQMNQQFNPYSAFTASPTCDLCNGDCNDWSCYGCGGCETPQTVQQTYMYPYQRQDAAFHDSFVGHEMALSGMVLWPVPKLPKALRKRNPPKTRSQTYEEEADDTPASGSGSGDEEDDGDDGDDTR